jgi:hypothetical protein
MVRPAFCALGIWLLACSATLGAAVSDQAAIDKAIETINAARALTADAISNAPLGFRRILFVRDVPDGFAAYAPRGNNVFTPDEPLIVYTEPIGVAWTKDGDEFSTKLSVDFEIRSPDGKVLAGQKGFGEFALSAREPPLDFMTHVKLDVTGAPAGAYVLGLTMHDTKSGKSTTVDLPFEIK